MIRLFKKTRQTFINEGKTSKYFKYAIGEIALVVAGILIALSINNWNENRIERKTIHSYLKKIESNIQQDLKVSQSLLEKRIHTTSSSKEALQMLQDKNFSNQKVIQEAIFGMIIENKMNYNRSAYEALKSSGSLSKLDNSSLEDLIYNYYSQVDDVVNSEKDVQKWSNELELELDKNGFMVQWMQFDTMEEQNLSKQLTLYNDALCEHSGHGIIQNLLFRGSLDFASDIHKHINTAKELSTLITAYIKLNK